MADDEGDYKSVLIAVFFVQVLFALYGLYWLIRQGYAWLGVHYNQPIPAWAQFRARTGNYDTAPTWYHFNTHDPPDACEQFEMIEMPRSRSMSSSGGEGAQDKEFQPAQVRARAGSRVKPDGDDYEIYEPPV